MMWLLLAAVALAIVVLAARRGRRLVVTPYFPISTFRMDPSRKQSRRTKAALDAASSTLR